MMTHNDVLKSLRYTLKITDTKMAEIFRLGDGHISDDEVRSYLKNEGDDGYQECSHSDMSNFLNGLVIFKRGKDETRPPQPALDRVTNNTVLKKVRVAFELKDVDMVSIIEKSGLKVTKTELSAFFRSPEHRNYRECQDQFLRQFLKGLVPAPVPSATPDKVVSAKVRIAPVK